MKKINMSEAASIVGGCCDCGTCVNTFEGSIVNGALVCKAVKTCTDKNGVVTKTYTATAASNCGGAN